MSLHALSVESHCDPGMTPAVTSEDTSDITPHIAPDITSGITRLSLSGFRSYPTLKLACDTRPVVITGQNGAGKTNILEAISFLSPGRGLRGIKLSEALCYPEAEGKRSSSWSVAVSLETPYGTTDIGTGLDLRVGENEKRLLRINREDMRSQANLSEHLTIQWLTPQMDRVFGDGVTARRRFLDRLVYGLDPQHAGRVMRYEHVMRERLRLLKQGGISQTAWLETLEAKMAESGVAIAAARLQTIETLKQAKEWALGVFPRAALSVVGECETDLQERSALEAEDHLQARLAASRSGDAESGRTLKGPHRSELKVVYVEKNRPAEHCSTGEQKALLISIIMAASRLQALRGDQVPLLLLDEVVAHLDEGRRKTLFDEILNLKIQAWMTGTDAALFQGFGEEIQHFKLANGELSL